METMTSRRIYLNVGIMQGNRTIARRIQRCDFDWSLEDLLSILVAQGVASDSLQSAEYNTFVEKIEDHGEYIVSRMKVVDKDITVEELREFSTRYNQILVKFDLPDEKKKMKVLIEQLMYLKC